MTRPPFSAASQAAEMASNYFKFIFDRDTYKETHLWRPVHAGEEKQIRGKPDEIKGGNYEIKKKSKFKDQK